MLNFKILKQAGPEFIKPIFILAAPRSGSTHLFEAVRRMQGPISLDRENTPLWLRVFPPQMMKTQSEYITAEECTTERLTKLKTYFALKLVYDRHNFRPDILFNHFILRKPICFYIEKTIANCFHLEALKRMFPDAYYIHLVRDGRANISSMIEGWEKIVNVNADLPAHSKTKIQHWSYPMPPNWQDQITHSIEEICAWSWEEHNRSVLDAFKEERSLNYMRIHHEDFVKDPVRILEKVSQFTGLTLADDCISHLNSNPHSRTTISSPQEDKWRQKYPEKIRRILPAIEPMMEQLGYICRVG